MARIDIDVENVDETFAEIEKDIHDGMEKAAHELATIAKEEAQTTIRENNAVFNYEVLESWRRIEAQSTPERVTVILTNRADHAPALNYGVDAAEYADGGPPVQALIPWVERKLSGWNIDLGGDGDGGSSPITTETIRNVVQQSLDEALDGIDIEVDVYGDEDVYLDDRHQLFQNLLDGDALDNKHVQRFFDNVRAWKSGGSKDLDEAAKYAVHLKESLNISAEPRGSSHKVDTTPDGMEDVVDSIQQLSQQFMEAHYADDDGNFKAYRTLRAEAPELGVEIWDDPLAEKWSIPTNAVNNYTVTRSNLDGFDKALLHRPEFDVDDDLLVAIDALIKSDWEYEGEIHIRGSDAFEFDRHDLDFESQDYSDSVDYLADQFFADGKFGPMQDPQMRAVSMSLSEMGENRASVRTDDGKMRVHNFIDEFIERGLHDDGAWDEDQWRRWESIITGEGPTLEFDGYSRSYEMEWSTYHPSDSVPLRRTFDGQEVEVFNVHTEQFEPGTITNRSTKNNTYDVELAFDTVRIAENEVNDWEIVGHENFSRLDESEQRKHIGNEIHSISFHQGFSADKRNEVRDDLEEYALRADDPNHVRHVYHVVEDVEKVDESESINGKAGDSTLYLKESATGSTTIHEDTHLFHQEDGYNSDRYPDNDAAFFNQLYDADGNHKVSGSNAVLTDNWLSDDSGYLPGDYNAGAVPEVIQKRVHGLKSQDYSYEPIDGTDDMSQLFHPDDGIAGPGDRLKGDFLNFGAVELEIRNIERDVDGDGPAVKVETNGVGAPEKEYELWMDSEGTLTNMRGVTLDEYAPRPNNIEGANIASVELREDTPKDRLYEATNLAWTQMVFTAAELDGTMEERVDEVPYVGRPYSTRAANEVITVGTELLFADTLGGTTKDRDFLTESNLRILDEYYEYFIEAWLENFTPTGDVKEVLDDLGYDV